MPDPFDPNDFSDIETLTPVSDPISTEQDFSDLDPASIVPIDKTETVFDEDRGQVFELPTGQSFKEAEYTINTKHELRDPGDFFGMEYMGAVSADFAKGAAAATVEMPSDALEVFRTFADVQEQPVKRGDFKITDANLFGVIRLARTLTGGLKPGAKSPVGEAIGEFQGQYDRWVQGLELTPEKSPLAFEFGASGAWVLASIGATVLTRKPQLVGPLFGLIEGGAMMKEGRAAGKGASDRLEAGALTGMFVGVTEALGGVMTLRHLSLNQGFNKALREAANNAVQEALQTTVGEAVSTGYKFKDPDLADSLVNVAKAAVFGAFWGGTAAGVSNYFQKSKVKDGLLKEGLSEEGANKVLDKITEAAENDPKVQEEIRDIWRHEWSPHNLSPEERAKRFAEIEKELQIRAEKIQAETEQQGPERSAAAEKVARGKELTPEEAEAFPEYMRIQLAVNQINEELVKTTNPSRIKQLKARKEAFLRGVTLEEPAASSTAESAPPVASASGADRSLVAEKVARGLALTDEEKAAMPDLAEIATEFDLIDDQLEQEDLDPETRDRLESERAGLLARVTFVQQKAVEQEEGDTSFEFGANVAPAATEQKPAKKSDAETILDIVQRIQSEGGGAFTPFPEENQPTGRGGDRQGIRALGSSDLSFDPELAEWAGPLGWANKAKRKADAALIKKVIAGEKLPAQSKARWNTIKAAWNESQPKPERRIRESVVAEQKAKLAERVTKAATLAERKRVREASRLNLQSEKAKAAFEQKFPEISILEKEALARSLQRQAETAKQATAAEKKRAKEEAKGKALNQKAKESAQGKAEERILESKALKRMHERMATVAREAAKWKKDDILIRMRLIRAIKNADINGILAEDRKKIQALQALLPEQKTVKLLTELNNKIQDIKNASKDKFERIRGLREEQHKQRLGLLLGDLGISSPEDVPSVPRTSQTQQRELVKAAKLAPLTAKRVFRDLGKFFNEIFYRTHNQAYSDALVLRNQMETELEAIKKKYNVSAEELGAIMEIDGVRLTMEDALEIFAVQSNVEHRTAIIEANKIPPETVEKIINSLSPRMQAVAAETAAWYESYFPMLASTVLDLSNGSQDLTKVKGVYVPLIREFDTHDSLEEEITADLNDRTFFSRSIGSPGVVKERTVKKGAGPGPVKLGLFTKAYRYASTVSNYVAMQRNLRELNRLKNEPALRETIRQKFGFEYVQYLDDYIERIAYPTRYQDIGTAGQLARALRERSSVLYIGGNLLSMAGQIPAVTLYLGKVGFSDLGSAISKFTLDPKGTVQFMLDKDPQMRFRNVSREADEQKQRMKLVSEKDALDKTPIKIPLEVKQLRTKLVSASFQGIAWIQQQIDAIGWTAAYDKALREGKSELEAIEAGQAAVLETQNATAPKDSAPLYFSSDWLDIVQQFTDQLNKQYNILFADIPHAWKKGDRGEAAKAALGLALSFLLYRIIHDASIPEEPEDWMNALLDGSLSTLPIIGPTTVAMRHHYAGAPAATGAAASAAVSVFEAAEAIAKGDYDRASDILLRGSAFVLKIPYPKSTVVRIKDMIEKVKETMEF